MMDTLKAQLKETFATVFSFYLKAANFHWNVEGPDFYQYHQLFNDVYVDTYNSIDPLAEHIRALGTYTPASYKRLSELTTVKDALQPLSAKEMLSTLLADNAVVLTTLTHSFEEAQTHNMQGLMNFLAARIEQHNKWNWFFRSITK